MNETKAYQIIYDAYLEIPEEELTKKQAYYMFYLYSQIQYFKDSMWKLKLMYKYLMKDSIF